MKRRDFLKLSCGVGAGMVLSGLGLNLLSLEAMAQRRSHSMGWILRL